ncbi:hypothetical protein FACS1894172_19560 [Spirochaetia bacterium]|nr:hypothetical protein FACS1894164_07730 [Spirochaetia bacterium]GHU36565.1 hypothetical protein FACS1894172_19560 [Spirochaetia bacterium]
MAVIYTERSLPKYEALELRLRNLLLFLTAALISIPVIWFLAVTPFLPFAQIELTGAPGADPLRLLRYAGISTKASFASLNPVEAESALRRAFHFESIALTKEYPNILKINIETKDPVAIALVELDEKTTPVYFDSNGVVVQIGHMLTGNFPIVSGDVFNVPQVGEYLIPPELTGFLPELDRLRVETPDLLLAISEIRIDQRSYGYDLVVYLAYYTARIRMSSMLDAETLKYALLFVDAARASGKTSQEFDFRSGRTATYTAD